MVSGLNGLLAGKVVVVSGGTQGVGASVAYACARQLAEAVVVTGRTASKGEAVVAKLLQLGTSAKFVHTDLADPHRASDSVRKVIAVFGCVDVLVNAAGLTDRGTLLDTTPELFDRHMATNLRAPFFTMQAVVADMIRREASGSIVNIISSAELAGPPHLAAYVAAKAGLAGLTKNVANAHRKDRIRVNGLDIGWTNTEGEDLTQRTFHDADDDWREKAAAILPLGRLGNPDEIGDFVSFLASERSGIVTGSILDWDQQIPGGYDW